MQTRDIVRTRHVGVVVEGQEAAARVARVLIERGDWFELSPLPGDSFEFFVADGGEMRRAIRKAVIEAKISSAARKLFGLRRPI
jgi:hypothetical protein